VGTETYTASSPSFTYALHTLHLFIFLHADSYLAQGEKPIMGSLIIYALRQTSLGQKVKEGERGEACSTHGGNRKYIEMCLLENLKGRNSLENPDVAGRTITQ
jgi:hypothetical protein